MHPEPNDVNFFMEHLGKILASIVAGLLVIMQYTGKNREASLAKDIINEKPVSMSQLLECQMSVNQVIRSEFTGLRTEIMDEIRHIHKRIDNIHGEHAGD